MRWWAVSVLLVVVFFGSVLLTAVAGFCNVGVEDGLLLERSGVFQGHGASLLATSFVWSRYPALPMHLSSLISVKAFLATVPLLLAALYFARALGRRSFPLLIAVCLAVALVPYAAGVIALHGNTITDPPHVGSWVAVMVLGPLYALVACAVICIVELMRPHARPRSAWGRLPLECSAVTTAAPRR